MDPEWVQATNRSRCIFKLLEPVESRGMGSSMWTTEKEQLAMSSQGIPLHLVLWGISQEGSIIQEWSIVTAVFLILRKRPMPKNMASSLIAWLPQACSWFSKLPKKITRSQWSPAGRRGFPSPRRFLARSGDYTRMS